MLPPRKPKVRSGIQRAPERNFPQHIRFVRSHACSVPDCANTRIEVAHVRSAANAGAGLKPADFYTLSLCSAHHHQQHQLGQETFEKFYGIDMFAIAREFARKSPDLGMRKAMREGGING